MQLDLFMEAPTKCPKCGFIADWDEFDVLGADWPNVFCVQCHCEFDPSTGAVVISVEGE